MRVVVPFGKRKLYTAIIIEKHHNPPEVYEAKPVEQVLDDAPIVNQFQLRHWQWIATYYMCTLGEVIRAALPKAFLLESETLIYANAELVVDENALTDDEFLIYEALQHQSSITIADMMSIVERKTVMPLLNQLLEKQVVRVKEKVHEAYKPKMVRYVSLADAYQQEKALEDLLGQMSRAPKQREAILQLFQLQGNKKPIKVSVLTENGKTTSAVIKTLVDKGVFKEEKIREDRISFLSTAA